MERATTPLTIDHSLTMDVVRIVERTAVAAAMERGRGDEEAADAAVVRAMHHGLSLVPFRGRVVIGTGDEGQAPQLYNGEEIGADKGPRFDIALDALESATSCAKNTADAVTVLAVGQEGAFLEAADVYMDKIAIGPGYPEGLVDLDTSPADNLKALAEAKGVDVRNLTACILDRPRHAKLIEQVRAAGAAIKLISDGDFTGVIHVANPVRTGIDIYFGIGGAPEGVLAAAALKCLGGQIQGRLAFLNEDQLRKARQRGLNDLRRKFDRDDMVKGDVVVAIAGVTEGVLLEGVRFSGRKVTTETLVMRASTGTARWIRAIHNEVSKFEV